MGSESNIQWTDATHNIARGCTKVVDVTADGKKVSDCKHCYMFRDSLDGTRYTPNVVVKTKTVFNLPVKYKKRESGVWGGRPLMFTSSLTDVYHKDIDCFRDEYWDIARKTPHIIKQILTKRPERINLFTPPDFLNGIHTKNVWLGTSCGSQAGEQRIINLCNSAFQGLKFLSLEPLWDRLVLPACCEGVIGWCIIGGESGFGDMPEDPRVKSGYRECDLENIESLVQQCRSIKIPVFIKQLGTHLAKQLKMSDRHGGNIEEFPEHLRIREFPKI